MNKEEILTEWIGNEHWSYRNPNTPTLVNLIFYSSCYTDTMN